MRVGPYIRLSTEKLMLSLILEKILESPLDCKEIKSILKGISPEYSLKGLTLKLKLQYSGYLMWRADSLKNTLMLKKFEGRRRKGQQKMRWLDGIPVPYHLSELAQTHVHQVGDAIQPSLPLLSPLLLPSIFPSNRVFSNEVGSLHQAAKVLELQHQWFQWLFRVDFL